ncbi:MAG: sugar porter family MFS transporter [Prolixibacteraceae bacterium]|jgi:sugar porter (SP) family MFS transporter|nr:sugar porter family MFS transporter [Bacteroidales bacterium]HNZ68985.1 sugar porter family MFS transporter [Prolixibacteraceae bacterium]HOC86719.1 sugar porter family MFS transporter [Prolixibacteraceae bacterium]HOG94638.1 sugar porter family MFS transporter [Prolixibacteraceae bacterium]HOY93190.1 sugar porter family MFS transporter [Prolixibacteraceae bacterium]
MKERYFLYRSAVVASLAGFLFGFDTVVISGAEQSIQALWQLSDGMHGVAVSMALWGTVLGALLGGWPSERFGRKRTLLWIGVLYLVSAVGSALAPEIFSFMFFRFVGGIGVGVSTVAAPMYISEIAPPNFRGRLTGMFQFNIVFGILMAFFSNSLIRGSGDNDWRWMLAVMAFPALIYALFCIGLPESPRWLIIHRRNRAAGLGVLKKVNPGLPTTELERLADEIEASGNVPDNARRGKGVSRSPRLLKPLFLAFFIAFFNQWSGINAILYYAPRIFEMTGLATRAALLQSVGIGITNLIFTFVGLWLIDRLGRRTLLLIGSFGYILSLGLTAWAFATGRFAIVPVCIFAFIAAHAIGQGAVIWVFISEIFPNRQRAAGQAFGSFTHWFFAAVITLLFPVMAGALQPQMIFGLFCGMMILQLLWVLFFVPETKGISLEKMENKLHGESISL